MRKRIAGAIAVACLTGVVLIGCSSGSYTENGDPVPNPTIDANAYVTKVQVDGQSVSCVVYRESIDCDFAGDLEKRNAG